MALAHSVDRVCLAGQDEDMQPEVSQPAWPLPDSGGLQDKYYPAVSSRQDGLTLAAQGYTNTLQLNQQIQRVSGPGPRGLQAWE